MNSPNTRPPATSIAHPAAVAPADGRATTSGSVVDVHLAGRTLEARRRTGGPGLDTGTTRRTRQAPDLLAW